MEHLKHWIGDLLNEIDSNQNTEVCIGLLKKCGANCAKRNALPRMTGMKAKISKLSDMDKIAEVIRKHTGAECIPDADGFTVSYNRGKGCDCSLVSAGYVDSPVFCSCTLGFHEMLWSTIFERPVTVNLLETFLRGGSCCAQRITFK